MWQCTVLGLASFGKASIIASIIAGLLTVSAGIFWYLSNGNGGRIKTIGIVPVSVVRN